MSAGLSELLQFVSRLGQCGASYRMSVVRPDAILVEVAVPGERWEVEFYESGDVEIERFKSSGEIAGAETLGELWLLLES